MADVLILVPRAARKPAPAVGGIATVNRGNYCQCQGTIVAVHPNGDVTININDRFGRPVTGRPN